MSRANQKKALVWKSSTTGLPQTGATIELRRGASTVTLTEIDTSGTYATDSIPVGEWAVWVDSANTGYTVAVGAGEASEPDYTTETGKYARSKADGSGFELVPLIVPFSALTEKPTTISGYGITDVYTKTETDAAYAKKTDVYTKTETDAAYAEKNGNIAEAFSALSATIGDALTVGGVLSVRDTIALNSGGVEDYRTTFIFRGQSGHNSGLYGGFYTLYDKDLGFNGGLSWGVPTIKGRDHADDRSSAIAFQVKDGSDWKFSTLTKTGLDIKGGVKAESLFSSNGLHLPNLPTSASGLVSGDVWNDSGVLKIIP